MRDLSHTHALTSSSSSFKRHAFNDAIHVAHVNSTDEISGGVSHGVLRRRSVTPLWCEIFGSTFRPKVETHTLDEKSRII